MAQHIKFHLVYDGPALAEHEMDVRALAPALLAMGDLFDRTNELVNGEQSRVALNVKASFKTGSFGIDFASVQSFLQQVLHFANSTPAIDVKTLLEWLGLISGGATGLIHLVRWLRGRGISKIEPIRDGIVRIYVDKESIDVEQRVLDLLRDYKIRKALEGVISEPLSREGIETFAIVDETTKQVHVLIEKQEARYFIAPDVVDESISDEIYLATLQVLNLAFQDGNKWRFTEGGNSYFADVVDASFLKRVQLNEEHFSKDDIIRARVRRTQRLTKEGLKANYEILEVLEHRSASPHVQIKLDFGGSPSDLKRNQ